MRTIFSLIGLFLLYIATPVLAQPQDLGKVRAVLNVSALQQGSQGVVAVVLTVVEHHHAQSHAPKGEDSIPTDVKPEPSPGIEWLAPVYPPGKDIVDPSLGPLNVYEGEAIIYVPFKVTSDAALGNRELTVTARYQICNEEGTCYPPEKTPAKIATQVVDSKTAVTPKNESLFRKFDPRAFASAAVTDTTAATSSKPMNAQTFKLFGKEIVLSSIWIVVPIALLVGLIMNVMPCVLPVLPLKALGFYEASQHNRAKTLSFGLMFSLGLILIFTALALFVILSKSLIGKELQWGEWFAKGWIVWLMTLLLVVLGAGMLGAFNVNLPNGVYGLNFRHDTLTGNFMWGGLTAILSTPCTAPMFAYILGWALTQPVYLATIGMIAIGVGMALPYLVLSAFPELARRFPRTGPASELVKQAMAFLMFGTAAWIAGPRLVGEGPHYWLIVAVIGWGCLFLIIRGATIFKTSNGVLALSAIVVLVMSGSVILAARLAQHHEGWVDYSQQAFDAARASGKPVLVKFTAAWCANCKLIEQTVYTDPKAWEAAKDRGVVMLKADLTFDDAPGWKLLGELGQTGIPFTAVYPPKKDKPITLASIYTTSTLVETLDQAKN
jgi:thiol:disulfide interchange protein DsbD